MCIQKLNKEVRGFSIDDEDELFDNEHYGNISFSEMPYFKTKKDVPKVKVNNEEILKLKFKEMVKRINPESSIATVKSKTHRKETYNCCVQNCKRGAGYLYLECFINHLKIEHNLNDNEIELITKDIHNKNSKGLNEKLNIESRLNPNRYEETQGEEGLKVTEKAYNLNKVLT